MSSTAQRKAIETYRSRLAERGIARFEVQALEKDRDLIRELARKMSVDDTAATRLRRTMQEAVIGEKKKGGVLAALLRAPAVGDDLDASRLFAEPRKIDL